MSSEKRTEVESDPAVRAYKVWDAAASALDQSDHLEDDEVMALLSEEERAAEALISAAARTSHGLACKLRFLADSVDDEAINGERRDKRSLRARDAILFEAPIGNPLSKRSPSATRARLLDAVEALSIPYSEARAVLTAPDEKMDLTDEMRALMSRYELSLDWIFCGSGWPIRSGGKDQRGRCNVAPDWRGRLRAAVQAANQDIGIAEMFCARPTLLDDGPVEAAFVGLCKELKIDQAYVLDGIGKPLLRAG